MVAITTPQLFQLNVLLRKKKKVCKYVNMLLFTVYSTAKKCNFDHLLYILSINKTN